MDVSEDVGTGKEKGKNTRLNMWMNTSHYEELKMLAEFEGRTVSDIVRQLVNIYLRDNADSIANHKVRKTRRIER